MDELICIGSINGQPIFITQEGWQKMKVYRIEVRLLPPQPLPEEKPEVGTPKKVQFEVNTYVHNSAAWESCKLKIKKAVDDFEEQNYNIESPKARPAPSTSSGQSEPKTLKEFFREENAKDGRTPYFDVQWNSDKQAVHNWLESLKAVYGKDTDEHGFMKLKSEIFPGTKLRIHYTTHNATLSALQQKIRESQ